VRQTIDLAVLLAPLVLWALAARTRRVGTRVEVALAAIAVLEYTVGHRWLFPDLQYTLVATLSAVTVAALIVGLVKDKRAAKPPRRSWRAVLGRVLVVVYCTLAIPLIIFATAWIGAEGGRGAAVPPESSALPLPTGLTMVGDENQGCGSGSSTVCQREIDVVPSGGTADATTVHAIAASLEAAHGWRLTRASGPEDWSACRDQGVLLDWVAECMDVDLQDGRAVIQISQVDSW
jgi:hypothetical protein